MAEEKKVIRKKKKNVSENLKAPDKLKILITIVDRSKTDFYLDVLTGFEVNLQTVIYGYGTAPAELNLLGMSNGKAIIMSVIKRKNCKKALETLNEKFDTIRNGKGIAYTIPIKSMIGVYIYQYLANHRDYVSKEDN